ncbi:MAG: enoyl-CoA hydratase [Pseudomonadales bacterium]|nr:enoyl-CoA hydratase [Pseudomonadales bacterium]
MSEVITTETRDGITLVTLNRPEALNALSVELRLRITETFQRLRDDPDTKVIILTGAGRAFSAGLDLKELGQAGLRSEKVSSVDLHEAVTGTGKPLIGAINGFAVTGGFEIALMCDILIASPQARFADTHVRMGVVPGWGLSQRLLRLVGSSRAKEISFTANYVDAETAERWGLVNRVVPADELIPHCMNLAREICQADALTLATVHELIDYGNSHTLAEGLAREAILSASHQGDTSAEALEERRLKVQSRGKQLNQD